MEKSDKSERWYESLSLELFRKARDCNVKFILGEFFRDLALLGEMGYPEEDLQRLKRAAITHYLRSTKKFAEEGLRASAQKPQHVKLPSLRLLCEEALAVNNEYNLIYDGAMYLVREIEEILSIIIKSSEIKESREARKNIHAEA